ncbi:hypothetical protein B0H14DRAFT_2611284 [Mycena olivaceomarginata]|nr:hypothetical protein B0H14DRAFT_2611284 [Mycena olivaceomarginata]
MKVVVSHGWQLDPVNPRFLTRLAPYGMLTSQMPSWAVTSQAKGCKECHENGAACVRLVLSGGAARYELPAVPHEKPASTSGFDFTLTDHLISTMNTELVNMYVDAILSSLTPLTGVDVAARIMSRVILYRQDARLREGCTPHADPSEVGAPLERCVDVLVRPGARREQFLERPFVPFQGVQYSDREHRLPLPNSQDPSDAAMYLTHILKDVVDRISAGAQGMSGSFGQHISQAFLPDRQVELPEGLEVGDRPLDLAGFVAGGDARPLLPHPLILPSESELSRFPLTYHFSSKARARLEEKYLGGIAHQHTDGRVTGPLVAGGFDTSEDDSAHEDDSARKDDSTGEVPHWPHTYFLDAILLTVSDVSYPAARRARGRGSLPPIDEEARPPTPPSSTAFTSVPTTPSNSSHMSFASVGSAGTFSGPRFAAASFDTTPTPQAIGSTLVGLSVGRFSTLDMTPLVPSVIVIHTHIARASSPGRMASVDAGNNSSSGELEIGDADDTNGALSGSMDSGGAAAGSSAGAGVEDVDME